LRTAAVLAVLLLHLCPPAALSPAAQHRTPATCIPVGKNIVQQQQQQHVST
jgi:hypothetical protein